MATVIERRMLFPVGRLMATTGVLAAIPVLDATLAIVRHVSGDWGELDEEDIATNDLALQTGYRLLSSYRSEQGKKFWIITEADRSVTTILLPEEY